jgi:hypothetical protein
MAKSMRRKSILKNVTKYNFQKPTEVEAKFDLEGYEEIESDQDSDEENEKINDRLEKIKKVAIKEQLLSSLPIGKRRRFKRKQLTEFECNSQLGYFFGNQILRGCFNNLFENQ